MSERPSIEADRRRLVWLLLRRGDIGAAALPSAEGAVEALLAEPASPARSEAEVGAHARGGRGGA
jgi:hypothetical protein